LAGCAGKMHARASFLNQKGGVKPRRQAELKAAVEGAPASSELAFAVFSAAWEQRRNVVKRLMRLLVVVGTDHRTLMNWRRVVTQLGA